MTDPGLAGAGWSGIGNFDLESGIVGGVWLLAAQRCQLQQVVFDLLRYRCIQRPVLFNHGSQQQLDLPAVFGHFCKTVTGTGSRQGVTQADQLLQ